MRHIVLFYGNLFLKLLIWLTNSLYNNNYLLILHLIYPNSFWHKYWAELKKLSWNIQELHNRRKEFKLDFRLKVAIMCKLLSEIVKQVLKELTKFRIEKHCLTNPVGQVSEACQDYTHLQFHPTINCLPLDRRCLASFFVLF